MAISEKTGAVHPIKSPAWRGFLHAGKLFFRIDHVFRGDNAVKLFFAEEAFFQHDVVHRAAGVQRGFGDVAGFFVADVGV